MSKRDDSGWGDPTPDERNLIERVGDRAQEIREKIRPLKEVAGLIGDVKTIAAGGLAAFAVAGWVIHQTQDLRQGHDVADSETTE